MLNQINMSNFDEETKTGLKLIEFYTNWCGYCKKQKSELEMMDKIWIGQIEADENPELAQKYSINAFPTFLIFKDGKEIERFSGLKKKEFILDRIMNHLK